MRSPPVRTRAPTRVAALTWASSCSTDADRGERTDLGVFLHGVADAHGFHTCDEARFEVVVDLVGDDEAFGGDAGLAAVDAAGAHGGFNGEVEVGGGHDDEGVAAAEFEDGFFDEPAGLGADGAAGGLAAGDGDGGDALVGEDGLDLIDFEQEGLKGAAREAGATDERLDRESALRDVGGVFEQSDVAGHQCRREKTEDLPEGEVPGHDGEDDAERVPAYVAVVVLGGDGLGREDAGGVVGVVAADVGALEDLESSGFERLAHLERDEGGEVFGLVFEDGGELAHPEGAMFERDGGVGAEGVVGEGDLLTSGLVGEGFEAAEKLVGCGIDGFDGHVSTGLALL